MQIISEILWNEISKVIPKKKSTIGRPLKDSRVLLSGIFYILNTGVQWRSLPSYYGKPTTAHHRFMQWIETGVFDQILTASIDAAVNHFGAPEAFITDTASIKAPFANFGGKNPTDRGKKGIKKGIVIDTNRIIFSILLEPANKHDSKILLPHIEKIRTYISEKPIVMIADSAWDSAFLYKELAKNNIALLAATNVRRDKNKKKYSPCLRWKIEQIFGIQHWHRGLKLCWSKNKKTFLALCQFAAAIHNFKLIGVFG